MDSVAVSEEDRASRNRRTINYVWEATQSVIALSVIGTVLFVAASLALKETASETPFLMLSNIASLVVGFYFGRTNHARPSRKQE